MKKIISLSSILLIIDQIIKLIISSKMLLNSSITIIGKFFNITYVINKGAAFSILTGNRLFLIIVSLISLILIYKYLLKDKILKNKEIIIYSLIIGGLLGNLLDRIIYGYVIDYLDFKIFNYNYPVFNFADICIVIGIVLLMFQVERVEHGK